MVLLVVAAVWIISAVFCYGTMFAHFQREFPRHAEINYTYNLLISLLPSIVGGPAAIPAALVISDFCKHGFKFI